MEPAFSTFLDSTCPLADVKPLIDKIQAAIRAAYVRGVKDAAAQIEKRLNENTHVEAGVQDDSTVMVFSSLRAFLDYDGGRLGRRSPQGIALYVSAYFPLRPALATITATKEELLTPEELCQPS